MTAPAPQIGALLERHQRDFDVGTHVERDPVRFPRRFTAPDDVEVVAFVAASLAFGRVAAFGPVLEELVAKLGDRPADFLRRASVAQLRGVAPRRYRWLEPAEIQALIFALASVLREGSSLEELFAAGDEGGPDTWGALEAFLRVLEERARAAHPRPAARSRALSFLFPSTRGSAACKRQHLFLRWMVRPAAEGPDFGLWSTVDARRLVMPCDVHVARIGHALGLTNRSQPDRRTADEITASLRVIAPDDPVRYDFALSHLGISGGCRAKPIERICGSCELRPACRWWVGRC